MQNLGCGRTVMARNVLKGLKKMDVVSSLKWHTSLLEILLNFSWNQAAFTSPECLCFSGIREVRSIKWEKKLKDWTKRSLLNTAMGLEQLHLQTLLFWVWIWPWNIEDNEGKVPYLGKPLAWACCFPGLSLWVLLVLVCWWLGISTAKEESDLSVGRVKPDGAFFSFFLLLINVDPSLIAAESRLASLLTLSCLFMGFPGFLTGSFSSVSSLPLICQLTRKKTQKI